MPFNIAQIKDKLTKALDGDKNVVDEAAVEEVITLLETSCLTKEILEQTRLGRDINTVRKTSKNPSTAKRARNLVKAWQKLLVVPGSPQVVNGQPPNASAAALQRISPGLQRISPGLSPATSRSNTPIRCAQSPALAQIKNQQKGIVRSPTTPLTKSNKSQKPSKAIDSKSPALARNNSNNDDSNFSWPCTPPSIVNESSQDRLVGEGAKHDSGRSVPKNCQKGTNKRNFNFDHKPNDQSSLSTSKSVNRAPDQIDVSKTNVANRKRTRVESNLDGNSSQSPSLKQPRLTSSSSPSLSSPANNKTDVINGSSVLRKSSRRSPGRSVSVEQSVGDQKTMVSSGRGNDLEQTDTPQTRANQKLAMQRQESVASRLSIQTPESKSVKDRTSKVKTTEQLIEEMQGKSTTPVGSQTIAQIRTNMIQKESDSQKTELPAGVKKRGRKKKQDKEQLELPDKDSNKLAQTKSEYIKRFLQTSVAPTPGEDIFEAPISHSRQESLEEQPISLGGCSTSFAQSGLDSSFPSYSSRQDKPDSGPSASPPEARDILENSTHNLPCSTDPTSPSKPLTGDQILLRLPPIDFDNIDWSSHDYPSPQPMEVGERIVERLHQENLDTVNGSYDRDGQFRRWHEMLTLDTAYDEPLHILPYVIPND